MTGRKRSPDTAKAAKAATTALNARVLWSFMLAVAIADAAGLVLSGMSVAPDALLKALGQVAALLLVSFVYTVIRPDERIASLTHVTAAFIFSLIVMAIFSYMTVTWHRPLIDEELAAADHALGLSWVLFYTWVTGHPLLYKVLFAAYASLLPQMTILLLILNYVGQCRRSWEMLWMFILACVGCIAVSAFWPAVGAFGHFHLEESRGYVRTFMALYNGAMKTIGQERIEGLVQFPSLHAALALIFAYSARGIRYLFPLLLAINILLFISTAPIGGHHFADLWGGAVLALSVIVIVEKAPAFARRHA